MAQARSSVRASRFPALMATMPACARHSPESSHSMETRLPAHLEVNGYVRAVQASGGFGMVLNKGERDGGTILIVVVENQGLGILYERMPQLDGTRKWSQVKVQVSDNKSDFDDYLDRRSKQDPDVWIVELTVADRERFVRDNLTAA